MKPFVYSSPGLGRDLHRSEVEEHAMAYGVYASAAVLLKNSEQARVAADWLVENPVLENKPGWGLPFPWDAFSDGSTNPVTTVYGVTTALAVYGLFDVYDLTGIADYRETAIEALRNYSSFFHESRYGGYFGYSDQPTDQIDVHNVSGLLMGAYARAADYTSDRSFREMAEQAKRHLDAKRRSVGNDFYWAYSAITDRPNDLVHAAYIAQGYIEYSRYMGRDVDVGRVIKYLDRFFDGGSIKEFPDHVNVSIEVQKRPARGWGVGMLIYTLAEYGEIEKANRAAKALNSYDAGEGVYSTTPNHDEFVPRIQSHIVLGLARLEQAKTS